MGWLLLLLAGMPLLALMGRFSASPGAVRVLLAGIWATATFAGEDAAAALAATLVLYLSHRFGRRRPRERYDPAPR
ncbi:hypothetical protein ACFOD4_14905 [Pseudoroseomonas globiformis]|uniref:Uncharacterized protein n=1 Tax=Teichococcus globiformis TaxID=2307229 RepID=A0ABV7G494_9PROT